MCDRVAESLCGLPIPPSEADRLRVLQAGLTKLPSDTHAADAESFATAVAPRFTSCEICRRIDKEMYDFLCRFQHDLVVQPDLRAGFVDHGGFCDFHTWQYQAVASSRGTCIGFPELLDRKAAGLRSISDRLDVEPLATGFERLWPKPDGCEACRLHNTIEAAAVDDLVQRISNQRRKEFTAVCLRHLRLMAETVENRETIKQIMLAEAETLDRVAEDMRRYVLKIDGIRRLLITREESDADQRCLMLLAGHRNVTGGYKAR
jgi:hypothetical protein